MPPRAGEACAHHSGQSLVGLVFDMAAYEQQRFLCLAHALRLAVLVHGRAYGWQVEVVDNDVTARREAPKACGR